MAENRLISNLEGILYYLDIPLLDFSVRNRQLVRAVNLSQSRLYPPELALYGISYGNLNEFFERRTMKEHSMFYREHLKAIGMEDFDFDPKPGVDIEYGYSWGSFRKWKGEKVDLNVLRGECQ